MKALVFLLAVLSAATFARAEEIYKITPLREYKSESKHELRERVWDLERAVWQLQQRVFQLEADAANTPVKPADPDTWVCTISAMGKPYVGTGPTKAVATAKATNNCRNTKDQDSFFCKDPKCEQ